LIFVIQAAEEKPISNIEQGMSKDEIPGSLSQRERGGEREESRKLKRSACGLPAAKLPG
jgi:hypothetical protein